MASFRKHWRRRWQLDEFIEPLSDPAKHAANVTSTSSRESAGRECRRSGEPVDPVVVRIARVAPDPCEGHVSPSVPYQTEQPLPEVSVLDRAVRSLTGAIAQPPLVPVLVEALLDVGAVSPDFDG